MNIWANKWLVSHREQMCPQWSLGNGRVEGDELVCIRMCVCVCLRDKERKEQDGGGFMDEKSSPVQMQILWRPHTLASVTLHSSLSTRLPLIKWPRSSDNLISLRGPDTWFNCAPITDLFPPSRPHGCEQKYTPTILNVVDIIPRHMIHVCLPVSIPHNALSSDDGVAAVSWAGSACGLSFHVFGK